MNAGARVQGKVEKLIPGGEGLMRVDGRAVFVPGVCPGETVSAEVVEVKKNWARCGKVIIQEASPDRRAPFCPHFGRCGGCSWQHLEYSAQLKSKELFVGEILRRQVGCGLDSIGHFGMTSSRPQAYRSRIRPIILPDGKAAFRSLGSDVPVAIDFCPVATGGVNRFLREAPRLLRNKLKSGDEPIVFGDDENYWLEGIHSEARAAVAGREFRFPPEAFFQSNLHPLSQLVDFVVKAAAADRLPDGANEALDLYGGVGLFGSFLADRFDRVVGVDSNPGAGEAWMRHLGGKGTFHAIRMEEWVNHPGTSTPQFIVVNPPRRGLTPRVRRALSKLGSPRIVYVSCDPVTQARDAKEFLAAGYSMLGIGLFDLYPQTHHLETAMVLGSGK